MRGDPTADTAATSAQNISTTSAGNAGALYGTLAPTLESEMANPQGYSQPDLAKMNTEAMETAGGTQAAATGAGALRAARTGNIGGSDAATARAARTGGEIAAKGALGTQIANAQLKESQRQAGASGLEGLFNTNTGASVNALSEVAPNLNASVNAQNESWDWLKAYNSLTGPFAGHT